MSDPDAPRDPGAGSGEVRKDTAGYLAWVAGMKDAAFANELGAAIDGALAVRRGWSGRLEWADVMTAAQRIVTHGGHPQDLTEEVRKWARSSPGHRQVRARREPALVVARPAWCGHCDQDTRLTLAEPPARCPDCHPLTQAAHGGAA
jgi:predicted Zn-ribbon and HTH transcriptional regulator